MIMMMMMMIPIVVTLVGIVTDESDVHPWKAYPPNDNDNDDDDDGRNDGSCSGDTDSNDAIRNSN